MTSAVRCLHLLSISISLQTEPADWIWIDLYSAAHTDIHNDHTHRHFEDSVRVWQTFVWQLFSAGGGVCVCVCESVFMLGGCCFPNGICCCCTTTTLAVVYHTITHEGSLNHNDNQRRSSYSLPYEGDVTVRTVVDRFSKMVHFIPLPTLPLAKANAEVMLHHIFCLRGLHRDVDTDRGRRLGLSSGRLSAPSWEFPLASPPDTILKSTGRRSSWTRSWRPAVSLYRLLEPQHNTTDMSTQETQFCGPQLVSSHLSAPMAISLLSSLPRKRR